jgi:O-antigen/teichoic acid export membrane protein
MREFFFSLIRAREEMQKEAGIFLLTNVAIVGFGFFFLHLALTAKSFSWGYVAGDAVGTFTAVFVLRSYFKKIFSNFSPKLVLPILRSAWPFAISGAFGLLFTNTDILIISWMRSASDVGIYSAAIRIIQTLYIIPAVIQVSTLPLLSRLAKSDNAKFRYALERTLGMIFFTSIPLAIGGAILGTSIMGFVFGAPYQAGGLSLEILMLTLLFDFPAAVIINALFAYEHQRSLVVSSALGGVVNVALDLVLIPIFGITGSAVATLIAQVVNNWYLWSSMKKVNSFTILPYLNKIILSSVIMGCFAIIFLLLGVNIIVNVILCGAIYFMLIKLLKEPIMSEVLQTLPIGRK